MKQIRIHIVTLVLAGVLTVIFPPVLRAESATVFAAASLKTALDDVASEFTAQTGDDITLAYGGTSVLARQIELGAPADLFLSANVAWMDHLERAEKILPASRQDLLGNRLALIVKGEAAIALAVTPELPLSQMLGDGRLAMALVDAVPAGIYGKAALQHLGLWATVEDKVAQTDNVRAALALVAAGAAPMGVVYATDALAEPKVTAMGLFPEDSHPAIVYPVALTRSENPTAAAFLAFLRSQSARQIFTSQGFTMIGGAE